MEGMIDSQIEPDCVLDGRAPAHDLFVYSSRFQKANDLEKVDAIVVGLSNEEDVVYAKTIALHVCNH